MGARNDYWVNYKRSVCIITYKKVVDYKNKNECSWEESARHFNLLKGEHLFIEEQYERFLQSKRIEEEHQMEHIKQLANEAH